MRALKNLGSSRISGEIVKAVNSLETAQWLEDRMVNIPSSMRQLSQEGLSKLTRELAVIS
jgi:hypothetical protein